MVQKVQIKRTSTPNSPPTGLSPGELAVEMDVPTRLWVGVPAAQDPSLRKLLYDSSAISTAYVLKTGDTMSGDLHIAKTGWARLYLNALDNNGGLIVGQRNGVIRWAMYMPSASPESGANAGSDFTLEAYSDTGTNLGVALTASRATGLLTVKANPTAPLGIATKQLVDGKVAKAGDTMTGNLVIQNPNPILGLNAQGTTNQILIQMQRDNVLRWFTGVQGGAESGVSDGSDFLLGRCNNTGVYIDSPMTISRSDGRITLNGDPTAPLHASTKQYVDNKVAAGGGTAEIPVGTVMLFYQAAAPVGWTQVTTQNDKALRVVSGVGGGVGGTNPFSTVMAQTAVGGRTLSLAELPGGIVSASPNRIDVYPDGASQLYAPVIQGGNWYPLSADGIGTYKIAYHNSVTHAVTGASLYWGGNITSVTSNNTGGGSHVHSITMAMQYIDVIIARKN